MDGFDKQRLISVLVTAATALFVMTVMPGRFPYRRATRIAAVAAYGAALLVALAWVVLWLFGAAS